MGVKLIGELEIHMQYSYVSDKSDRVQVKNDETYQYLQCLFNFMSNMSNELKKLYIHSNYMYVEHVELYSCNDISD